MSECLEQIRKDKLVILARGIPVEKLLQALEACAQAGVTLFESTFDHRLGDPVTENREKLKTLKKALGSRIRVGAGTVLTKDPLPAASSRVKRRKTF